MFLQVLLIDLPVEVRIGPVFVGGDLSCKEVDDVEVGIVRGDHGYDGERHIRLPSAVRCEVYDEVPDVRIRLGPLKGFDQIAVGIIGKFPAVLVICLPGVDVDVERVESEDRGVALLVIVIIFSPFAPYRGPGGLKLFLDLRFARGFGMFHRRDLLLHGLPEVGTLQLTEKVEQ